MESLPLRLARQLQALAQTGLHFSHDPFDRARYAQLTQIAAELMAHDGDEQAASLIALFERESGYATPKVDVRAAVFDVADRLLLVRERSDGLWALPGGWADVGASPARTSSARWPRRPVIGCVRASCWRCGIAACKDTCRLIPSTSTSCSFAVSCWMRSHGSIRRTRRSARSASSRRITSRRCRVGAYCLRRSSGCSRIIGIRTGPRTSTEPMARIRRKIRPVSGWTRGRPDLAACGKPRRQRVLA